MTNGHEFDQTSTYKILVKGRLDESWSDWVGGFEITPTDGETLLCGEVPDQAALYGILSKLGELGFTLLSIEQTGFSHKK